MKDSDLKINNVYEAKNPIFNFPYVNDRQIIWIGHKEVQYDGPAIKMGQQRPIITKEKFLKWAGRDITDIMPSNDSWRGKLPQKNKKR